MKRLSILATLCVGLMVAPLQAGADTGLVELDGAVAWSAVSGDTGKESKILGNANDVQAGYSIRWWESTDDPCKVRLYTRHLNLGTVVESENSFCTGSPGNEKWAERRGANEYITALQVCTNDTNDTTKRKVKGIRVWGRTANLGAGTLGPENGPDESIHANCSVWKSKVSCPSGQVAAKIKVDYDQYTVAGYAKGGFTKGISLGCRKLQKK